jgi:O-methyltransferase
MIARIGSLIGAVPFVLRFLFDPAIGREYGVGALAKLRLIVRFKRNIAELETLSSIREHMELARAIFAVPRAVPGDVVECGCYLGGSSANISLVCKLAGRKLAIYDSFEGLPEPSEQDRKHVYVHYDASDDYYKGRFAASLDQVKANITRYGAIEVCEFVQGFFDATLPGSGRDVVLAFLDVDLVDSLKPCLLGIWNNLPESCRVYVHEAASLSLVSLFFDDRWWREQLGGGAPGFVGSGSGLPLTAMVGSELGYAQKGSQLISDGPA